MHWKCQACGLTSKICSNKNSEASNFRVFISRYPLVIFFRHWPHPKKRTMPLSRKYWSCWRIFAWTLWFAECFASVRIKILPQHMKALRANCASPTDFHELRQGFIPPNYRPSISFGIDHVPKSRPRPYLAKTEVVVWFSPWHCDSRGALPANRHLPKIRRCKLWIRIQTLTRRIWGIAKHTRA